MKDTKTLIAVLISLVVVVGAFYIRFSPPEPEPSTISTLDETALTEPREINE